MKNQKKLVRYQLKNYEYSSTQLNLETLIDEDGIPFHPACMYLFHQKCSEHSSDNTCYNKAIQIKEFLNYLITYELSLKEVNTTVMQKYLYGYLFKLKGLKSKSIEIHAYTLQSFFKFCYQRGFVNESLIDFYVFDELNITVSEKSYADIALEIKELFISESDLKLLCAHVSGSTKFIKKRNKLILKLGYYAGLRTSDIASNPLLTVGHIRKIIPHKFENSDNSLPTTVSISYLNKKSKKKTTLQIGSELISELHDYVYHHEFGSSLKDNMYLICKNDGAEMVDDKLGSRTFSDAVRNLIKNGQLLDSEIELWLKRHYHLLRKCFATNMVVWCREQGLPPSIIVRDYLGHSDFRTSLKHYIIADWLINQHNDKEYLDYLKADETSLGKSFSKRRGDVCE